MPRAHIGGDTARRFGIWWDRWTLGACCWSVSMASYYNALVGGLDAPEVVVDAFHVVRVRREAPFGGCKDPPPACRSRPVKLEAA